VNGGTAGLAVSTMLASAVEFVEAFTIVLAMGLTRGWRSTLAGTISALVLLAGVAAVAGYALITWFPKSVLQLAIGSLLLVFGLQWLRKSILRASGLKALHDEDETFREETEAGRQAARDVRAGLDWFGFVVSFKGVFLEGLEVIFIVITFGLTAHSMPTAIVGASIGGVIVLVAGLAFHKPLSRVPENMIKFAVGLLLSTFGTFWAVEGIGVFRAGRDSLRWPGGDAALLAVLAAWCALSWLTVRLLSTVAKGELTIAPAAIATPGEKTA
jgi:Ca2+/H+ antiporter, TMEM165/GDT1 family